MRDNGDDLQGVAVFRRDLETGDVDAEWSSFALKYHGFAGPGEFDLLAARHFDDPLLGGGGNVPLGGAVWLLAPAGAGFWAVLFCGPLVAAVPFAVLTSRVDWGRALVRLGVAATPEELRPPPVVVAAGHALRQPGLPAVAAMPVALPEAASAE